MPDWRDYCPNAQVLMRLACRSQRDEFSGRGPACLALPLRVTVQSVCSEAAD
jgi:hypothetical protein